ncbi:hypothetical protein M2168_001320 [Streptomyces sp. CZ24]|nr:hypothetical protein [Streptomyces sp. CZ24]
MVAEHEVPALGDAHGEAERGGLVAGVEVGLGEGRAVDGDPVVAVAADHGVAADRHDPLDQVALVVGGQQADRGEPPFHLGGDGGVVGGGRGLLAVEPVGRVLEDDDVATLGPGAEVRGQFVDDDAVADPDGLLH